ncbi:signal transduction histidine kinase [Flavobacterium arsenatis]|uniref:histidine kinase n=1 Tax=Flavobacterium arsenatis TaxID=1484332 RepID=A0ABU1TR93_9FLAO|nr:tetratricopeptide repeat protein [Flavobacterium arsenatis]MDR6968212.1 signal transduction histidine kinase [Flavobacterium arsenatis]
MLFKASGLYYELDRYDKYLATTTKIQQLAIESRDTAHLAKSLYFIGDYYERELQIDSAFKYYSKAERLYKKIDDALNSGRTILYKAGILYDAGIFTESEMLTAQALEFLNTTENERLVYEGYNLMALNLKELNDYKNSLRYFNLALKKLDLLEQKKYNPTKLIKSRASIYNNMGGLYEKAGSYNEAIKLYERGLASERIKESHPRLYAMLLNHLASALLKKGGNDEKIEALLLESLEIRKDHKIEEGIVSSKISIGEFYLQKKQTCKGIEYIRQGYELAKKINSSYDSKNALKLLSENDGTDKGPYDSLYMKITDSLYTLERNTRNKFARIAYETNQVEKKNAFLSRRNRNITVGAACIILILGTSFIIYRLRSKNKELLFIKKQKESNEKIYQLILGQRSETDRVRLEERNRIAMELHDGIVNRIFTTRFNLMLLQSEQSNRKEELVQELIAAETEIRKVSHDLQHNLLFEDDSFQKTLTTLVAAQQNEFSTVFDLSIDKYIDWSLVSSEKKIHVYRIIQEAIQNINKYARAKKAEIILLKTGNKITLRILDDGIGFNLDKARNGIGLKNIRQRTHVLKGECTIDSKNEHGTRLEIVFQGTGPNGNRIASDSEGL